MSRSRNFCRLGHSESVVASTAGDELIFVAMKEQIGPNGSAKAYKTYWSISEDKRMPLCRHMSALFVNASNPLYVANLRQTAESENIMFAAADVSTILSITGSANGDFNVDDYAISEVVVPTYTDLMIDSSSPNIVSSRARPFTVLDNGLELLVTSEDGFYPGLYPIIAVDAATGKATLASAVGTLGATGGRATGTPYAKLTSAPAPAGSSLGSGILGAFDVYETLGDLRAWGIDDLGDAVNHLEIDATDNTKISNAGTPFESDDDDKILIINGGTGFTAGMYHVIESSGGVLTLDRPCGICGSTGGYGEILRADPAIGIAEQNADSGHLELVALHCIAKTAKAIATVGYDSGAYGLITPDTSYVMVLNTETLDGGQLPLSDAVVASYSDLKFVPGYINKIYSTATPFTANDEDLILTIPDGSRMMPGNYAITDVDGSGYATLDRSAARIVGDLEIPAGETTKVESNSLAFVSGDTAYDLVVLSGTGFNAATYGINSVSAGVATLGDTVGTSESVGGEGYIYGSFSASGTTRKPLQITNDEFSIPNGATTDIVWDETSDVCRVRPLRSHQYDRCTCTLIADLATTDTYVYVKTVVPIQGKSPLIDPDDTDETLKVYNRSWDGDAGAACDIRWNEKLSRWEFDFVPCVAT